MKRDREDVHPCTSQDRLVPEVSLSLFSAQTAGAMQVICKLDRRSAGWACRSNLRHLDQAKPAFFRFGLASAGTVQSDAGEAGCLVSLDFLHNALQRS